MPAILTIKAIAVTAAIAVPNTPYTITQAGTWDFRQKDYYECLQTMNALDARWGSKVVTSCDYSPTQLDKNRMVIKEMY